MCPKHLLHIALQPRYPHQDRISAIGRTGGWGTVRAGGKDLRCVNTREVGKEATGNSSRINGVASGGVQLRRDQVCEVGPGADERGQITGRVGGILRRNLVRQGGFTVSSLFLQNL